MSRFKALESPLEMTREYFAKLQSVALNLIRANDEGMSHPFLKKSDGGPLGLFVVSAESGLCGIYNNNLLNFAEEVIAKQAGRPVKLYVLGRKGASHLRKEGLRPEFVFPVLHGRLKPDFHSAMYKKLEEDFLAQKVAEIYVIYTRFVNAMKHIPTAEKLLSIDVPPAKDTNFIIESGQRGVFEDVVPMYASNKLRLMIMESLTSEHAARMVAMRAAKDNAKELVGDLILLRNKIRQANITREIIEIVSSAEALKG